MDSRRKTRTQFAPTPVVRKAHSDIALHVMPALHSAHAHQLDGAKKKRHTITDLQSSVTFPVTSNQICYQKYLSGQQFPQIKTDLLVWWIAMDIYQKGSIIETKVTWEVKYISALVTLFTTSKI